MADPLDLGYGKNRPSYNLFGDSKYIRASKLHCWFKSYNDFADWVDFAYWWGCSGGGFAFNGATPSSFI